MESAALIASSLFVSELVLLSIQANIINQITVLVVVLWIVAVNVSLIFRSREIVRNFSRTVLLLLTSILVQLIIVTTGGVQSPFFILLHLTVFLLSVQVSFSTSMVFLCLSLLTVSMPLFISPAEGDIIRQDPGTFILYILSILIVIPLAQLLARHFRLSKLWSQVLANQIKVGEMILESVADMIIITDTDLRILSVNDATERILSRPASALLRKPLLSVLFLKDSQGQLLKPESLHLDSMLQTKEPLILSNATLLSVSTSTKRVQITVRPIVNLEGVVDQISFILSSSVEQSKEQMISLDSARVKLSARIEEVRKKLTETHMDSLAIQMRLIAESEKDIFTVQAIEGEVVQHLAKVDVADLCRQVVNSHISFSNVLKVPLTFDILSFSLEDIKPFITNVIHVTPEEFTGPFFTAPCDPDKLTVVLSKLIEVSLLLASSAQEQRVSVTIKRDGQKMLLIQITATAPVLPGDTYTDIFVPYYNRLSGITNLSLGSGLEGYVAKTLCAKTNIDLATSYDDKTYRLISQIRISKATQMTA